MATLEECCAAYHTLSPELQSVYPFKDFCEAYFKYQPRYLQDALPRMRYPPNDSIPCNFHSSKPPLKNPIITLKKEMTYKYRDDLRIRKLCFAFQDPCVPGHKCSKGKTYCIEVFSKSEPEEEEND